MADERKRNLERSMFLGDTQAAQSLIRCIERSDTKNPEDLMLLFVAKYNAGLLSPIREMSAGNLKHIVCRVRIVRRRIIEKEWVPAYLYDRCLACGTNQDVFYHVVLHSYIYCESCIWHDNSESCICYPGLCTYTEVYLSNE